jgi:hypothetical protein
MRGGARRGTRKKGAFLPLFCFWIDWIRRRHGTEETKAKTKIGTDDRVLLARLLAFFLMVMLLVLAVCGGCFLASCSHPRWKELYGPAVSFKQSTAAMPDHRPPIDPSIEEKGGDRLMVAGRACCPSFFFSLSNKCVFLFVEEEVSSPQLQTSNGFRRRFSFFVPPDFLSTTTAPAAAAGRGTMWCLLEDSSGCFV